MPPPHATTEADVRAWLVAFFLSLPNAPVYATTRGRSAFVDGDRSASTFDWPRFSAQVLGDRSRARLWLLTWARCEARRRALARNLPNPPAGGTVAEFCREFGIERATFDRSVRRSLTALATAWNRCNAEPGADRVPPKTQNAPEREAPGQLVNL